MVAAVLIAFASLVTGGWMELVHDADPTSATTHDRDDLTRPDAPGAELLLFPGLERPDAAEADAEIEPEAWVPPPASGLRRPESPSRALARSGQLSAPSARYDGLGSPEARERLLNSLIAPDSPNATLAVPDPERKGEPLLQRPTSDR